MRHQVVTKRDHLYPFKPYWACVCGFRFKTTYMGPALYREFAAHEKEKKDVHDR